MPFALARYTMLEPPDQILYFTGTDFGFGKVNRRVTGQPRQRTEQPNFGTVEVALEKLQRLHEYPRQSQ